MSACAYSKYLLIVFLRFGNKQGKIIGFLQQIVESSRSVIKLIMTAQIRIEIIGIT